MIIDNINLNHLRIFECVYRTQSMTLASKELHLTQSGVSQHMKSLEDVLGLTLFDRIKQRLVPTSEANELFKRSHEMLQGLEATISDITGGKQHLAGTVAIGMPIEFGNNVIMPLLARFCHDHPKVKFYLRYGFATEMSDEILSGKLDFAFVDEFKLDSRIQTEKVYDEVLQLCATTEFIKTAKKERSREDRMFFESLEYVDYQEGEPVLRKWFEHHLGARNLKVNVRATVMDVQGVSRLIKTGQMAGVLPGYLVEKLKSEGKKIETFKGSGKTAKNKISVAYLPGRSTSNAAKAIFKSLLESVRAKD
ncbi:MAG: LysR family transcriptional regulator [Bdellovibrionota bacterium]